MLKFQVCATRTSNTSHFFSHETQFALVEVLNAIPNDPPEITNLVENIFMNEDAGVYLHICFSVKSVAFKCDLFSNLLTKLMNP